MGAVWVAEHTTLGTEVAIKFVDIRGDSTDALRRFEREANLVARLRSPHVVQILDYGVDEAGRPYLAMELLSGESLKDRLERTRTMPIDEVATLVIQVCRALHRAHKAGVVHRDIKPANIFLSDDDGQMHVKMLDFGVAKANPIVPGPSDAQKTETGAIIGTPAYMSPEQVLASAEIDGRSDLFSLGVLAWRMVVGFNPHEAGGKQLGFGELLIQIATKHAPPPSQYVEGITPEIDAWFERALALEPKQRFPNARAMADAIAKATHLPSALLRTGEYAANPDASGAHSLSDGDDSGDARAPDEVAALRASGETSSFSGARRIQSADRNSVEPAEKKSKKGLVWIGVAAAIVLGSGIAWSVRSKPPAATADTDHGSTTTAAATGVPAGNPSSVAAPAPPAPSAEPAPAADSAKSAPASATADAKPSRAPVAAPPPRRAPARTPPPPTPAAHATAKPPEAASKPASTNTLLDDRL